MSHMEPLNRFMQGAAGGVPAGQKTCALSERRNALIHEAMYGGQPVGFLSAPAFARPEIKNPGFVTCSKAGRGVARGLRLHYSADALGWYEFLGLFAGRGFYRWN